MNIDNCKHNSKFVIYPDFTASGLWCECGLAISNPKIKLPKVPPEVFDMLELWNGAWEDYYDKDGINKEYIQSLINSSGNLLQNLINEYIDCDFYEARAKLK